LLVFGSESSEEDDEESSESEEESLEESLEDDDESDDDDEDEDDEDELLLLDSSFSPSAVICGATIAVGFGCFFKCSRNSSVSPPSPIDVKKLIANLVFLG
jgi:hypothetical protein